ncbi:prolow-density lipoprotein receptor-related protein 1-like [Babylonia areolata]|uniref:prolow-density lipoprotein receptor-related protein 1-like n=1 Tax=Babylonia areolata TaxID=304850 RepID=UPI003FD3DBB8
MMEVNNFSALLHLLPLHLLIVCWIFCCSPCLAIQHETNLIWAQTPVQHLAVSRLVGISGDPGQWVPYQSPSVKHISAPHYGWEFKGLGFSYRKQLLVWSESMNKKIQGLYLNGSTETVDIFTGTSSEVHGLAVDWLSNNVYWTDALYNWILMAPLQSYSETDRVYSILVQEGLDNPHGLAVHPANNMLLMSDWGVRPRIELMDLLGQNRKVLVDRDMLQPRGLTLDVNHMTLFWVDSAKSTIESVSLVGGGLYNHRRKVVKTDAGSKFFDLAIFNGYVFATEQSKGLLKVFEVDSQDSVSFKLANIPYGIVMYDQAQQPGPLGGCDSFGCEHMCIEDLSSGPRCLCGEGYLLDDNMKNCISQNRFVHPSHLYAIGVAICMYPAHIADMSLDNVSLSSQCFLSDRFGYLALTFHAAENLLFYSGNYTNTISVIALETGAKAKVVASGTGTVKGLALDWVVGTLYWTDSTNGYIKMCRKDGRFQRILLEKDVNSPLGIAVYPARGKIYWTDIGWQPDVMPKIESANMDGSEREILFKDNLGQPNHIMIDYDTDKLYWADSILNHIRQYDLNDRTMTVFFQQPNVRFYGLSLYKDYVLWTDTEDMNGIHVARLDTKRKVRSIIHPKNGLAADLITFDTLNQPDMASPCNNSRQCAQLCLPRGSQSYTCSCGLGFELVDKANCTIGSVSRDQFLLVNDAYQFNMYQVDSRKGQITAMSLGERHQPIALAYHPPPSDRLYWSDNTAHVIRRKPLGLGPAESFLDLPVEAIVDGLAIDHLNNLLFYADTGRDLIAVVTTSLWPPRQAIVIREGLDEPRAIVVSSAEARIYWTDWGQNASIQTAHMNGQDPKVLVRFNTTAWPNGLAIDTKEHVLYWADASSNHIGEYQLDSGRQRILLIEPQAHYFGLFLMGDFLYVTDWKRSFVSRMHKRGGQLMQFGEAKFTKLYGITGYNSSETPKGGIGICANQTKCDNVSVCVPHSVTAFTCVCIQGYQQVGPRCQKVIASTTTPSTSTLNTTTTTDADAHTTLPTTTTTTTRDPNNSKPPTTPPPITIDTGDNGNNKYNNNSSITNNTDVDHTLPPGENSNNGQGEDSNNSGEPDSANKEDGDGGSATNGKGGSGGGGGGGGGGGAKDRPVKDKVGGNAVNKTGIIAASVGCSVVIVLIVILAAYLYFRRRRGYQVPHTRLTEERGRKRGSVGSSPTSTIIASSSSSSCTVPKVMYARHNSNDSSVHFDEGFENPTYDVTMAMLSDEQPTATSSFGGARP